MIHDYLQSYTLSIVLVGQLNPPQFQPFWISGKKLIREHEAEKANIQIIHKDIVKYDLDWVSIDVNRDRFELRCTKEPYFGAVKDLALSIFSLLRENPVKGLGINHIKDFSLNSKERYYEFGNKISPLTNWDEYLNDPRLLSLEILEEKRQDGFDGLTRVRVQKSNPKLEIQYGVSFDVNDHYNLSNLNSAREILGSQWENSANKASNIMESIWKKLDL